MVEAILSILILAVLAIFIYFIYVIYSAKSLSRQLDIPEEHIWSSLMMDVDKSSELFSKYSSTMYMYDGEMIYTPNRVDKVRSAVKKGDYPAPNLRIPLEKIIRFRMQDSWKEKNLFLRIINKISNTMMQKNTYELFLAYLGEDGTEKELKLRSKLLDNYEFESAHEIFESEINSAKIKFLASQEVKEEESKEVEIQLQEAELSIDTHEQEKEEKMNKVLDEIFNGTDSSEKENTKE